MPTWRFGTFTITVKGVKTLTQEAQRACITSDLDSQGFAIVSGILSEEETDFLTESIEHFTRTHQDQSLYAIRHLLQAVPEVRELAQGASVRGLVEPVLGPGAFVARSLFFDKTPVTNWKVAWHQDLTIAVRKQIDIPGFSGWSIKNGVFHVQPPVGVLERMLTVRVHLDDCDPSNGPLQIMPGSHKVGRLSAAQISEWRRREQPFVCSVPQGGALLMRPLLLHASSPATKPKHRRVVHLEFTAKALPGGLEWVR